MTACCCAPQIFTGFPIYNYAKKHPSRFAGVNLFVPQDGSFPSEESAATFRANACDSLCGLRHHSVPSACNGHLAGILFFTQIGKINFTGSVRNMNVVRHSSMPAMAVADVVCCCIQPAKTI